MGIVALKVVWPTFKTECSVYDAGGAKQDNIDLKIGIGIAIARIDTWKSYYLTVVVIMLYQ